MKPSLYQMLTIGKFTYSQIAQKLNMRRTAVHWFALELERRGWIKISPSHLGLINKTDGDTIRFVCSGIGGKK
ncbi:TPA: hypothetical protein M6A10_002279 [Citrobacter amalonaticus]|nr:hypothetical protein [Citrobacter amalonaticus]HCC6294010.1 hypothetical protein [Citrobacter amalonaticus]HCC6430706.1 hypothetical protein [Citrobacter amalonaticus]HCC7016913.1 hypothetical protein [Citrobacter amalonaticus]